MLSNLYVVPQTKPAPLAIPSRPADLIQLAQPRLNKCDWVEEYYEQLRQGDYDTIWARVTETVVLDCKAWNDLMKGFLTDRTWLAGKGGSDSWAFSIEDRRDWLQLSESERNLYRETCFSLVIKVVSPTGSCVYIDPQGYDYARYVAFDLAGLRPEKSRAELERERAKAACAKKLEELKQRIANPPEVPADHGLRFLWNGMKHNNGKLVKCSYSKGTLLNYPEDTITIYARDYRRFPEELTRYFHVENDTDSQSDYFDDDKFRVCPNHPLYSAIRAAFDAQETHHEKRMAKRAARNHHGSIDL